MDKVNQIHDHLIQYHETHKNKLLKLYSDQTKLFQKEDDGECLQ